MLKFAWKYAWIVGIAVFLLLVSQVLPKLKEMLPSKFEGSLDSTAMLPRIFEEIGLALISGFVVAIAIEHGVVTSFLTRVARDVYGVLYGAGVPDKVAKYVEEKFVKYPFREKHKTLKVTLDLDNDRTGADVFGILPVKLTITQTYVVRNVSNKKSNYLISVNIENILLDCLKIHDKKVEKYGETSVSVAGKQVVLKDNKAKTLKEYHVTIAPNDESEIIIYQKRLRLAHDTEVWICKNTIEDYFSLIVEASEDFLLCGIPTEPSSASLEFKNTYGTPPISKKLEGPIFPGHGFILWWRPTVWGGPKEPLPNASEGHGPVVNGTLEAR